MLRLDGRGKLVEPRDVSDAAFLAHLIAGSFDRAFGRLDRVLKIGDLGKLGSVLRLPRVLRKQTMPRLGYAAQLRRHLYNSLLHLGGNSIAAIPKPCLALIIIKMTQERPDFLAAHRASNIRRIGRFQRQLRLAVRSFPLSFGDALPGLVQGRNEVVQSEAKDVVLHALSGELSAFSAALRPCLDTVDRVKPSHVVRLKARKSRV